MVEKKSLQSEFEFTRSFYFSHGSGKTSGLNVLNIT